MNNIEESIKAYVGQANIMQLGTSENDQPWICTLHFYSDADLNFYWCSTTDRRHSKELAHNSKAACYRLKAEQIVLFNNKDFPENPRQVIRLN